ncbi:hypothetical protein MMSR116_31555 [Methylobacterium mesophilicum SR1.6/6]|uniref:Uncharacterized protein n=1 Tax=Methylobacterium mesophilicum SR1.6/6 TaxID=908290 RepID=A0A6B9G244_9HYPH|nr:hypothetical protein [Methylobacterium mesophilicum]QGY05925.1 hypothetical protein MMSR116_31555 [Methylobacterium mesophilicum SR1.6/6]
MHEFLVSALIAVPVACAVSVPAGLLIARLAVKGPPRWLKFYKETVEPQQAKSKPIIFVASAGTIIGAWRQTSAAGVTYGGLEIAPLAAPSEGTLVFDGAPDGAPRAAA